MPKVKAPTPTTPTTETPAVEQPKVDMSPLISQLTAGLAELQEAEGKRDEAQISLIVECRAFREENPTAERSDMRLAIQTAVAEQYSLKLAQVQSKPTKEERIAKEIRSQRESAYVLVSTLLSMAWPKDEKQDTKVAKLLEGGETRFTVIRDASRKPSQKSQRDPDANKITVANFTDKYAAFATQAFADIGKGKWDAIFNLLDEAREALEKAVSDAPAE